MRCSRCSLPFSPTSAIVTDHRYVQHCIDALKGRIKELESTVVAVDGGTITFHGVGGTMSSGGTVTWHDGSNLPDGNGGV